MRRVTVIVREKLNNENNTWPSLEGRAVIQKQFETKGEAQVYMIENPEEFPAGYVYHFEDMYFD